MRKPALPFRRARELRVLDLLKRHAELCALTVEQLREAFNALRRGDVAKSRSALEELFKTEEEADGVRREIAGELAKEVLPPLYREDMMQLIERVDLVADWAKDVGRILTILLERKEAGRLLCEACRPCGPMVEKLVECVKALRQCLEALLYDVEKAIELCYEVERVEEEIDSLYVRALGLLYASGLPANETLLLYDLVKSIEETADLCEDASDVVKVIAIRSVK